MLLTYCKKRTHYQQFPSLPPGNNQTQNMAWEVKSLTHSAQIRVALWRGNDMVRLNQLFTGLVNFHYFLPRNLRLCCVSPVSLTVPLPV